MVVTDPNGSEHRFIIEGCVRRKLDAVHIVRVPEGTAVAFDSLVGKDITVHVDWERRMDHMITHTAQHLLSAVLDTRELNTLSWGMDAHPTFDAPYVELPRALTWAEAYEVEAECNARIREARKVWIDVTVQEEGVSDADRANELERESRNLPKDYSGVSENQATLTSRVSFVTATLTASTATHAAARNVPTSASSNSFMSFHLAHPPDRTSQTRNQRACGLLQVLERSATYLKPADGSASLRRLSVSPATTSPSDWSQ